MKTAAASRSQAGLTLLEVIIGVIILSIAASILVVTSRTSMLGQTRSKVYGDAATATKEALQTIQLLPLDSVSRLDNNLMEHSQGPSVEVRASSRSLTSADVTDLAAFDTSSLRYITLATSFHSQSGITVSKVFHTIVYRP